MAWTETEYSDKSEVVTKDEAYQFWYQRGYDDGDQFHTEFNFKPWWSEFQMLAYWRGWRDGKDVMVDKVNRCNNGD